LLAIKRTPTFTEDFTKLTELQAGIDTAKFGATSCREVEESREGPFRCVEILSLPSLLLGGLVHFVLVRRGVRMGFLILDHLLNVARPLGQGGFVESFLLELGNLCPEGTEFLANFREGEQRLFLLQFVAGFRAEQHIACQWSFRLIIVALACSLLFFLLFVLSVLFVVLSSAAAAAVAGRHFFDFP